MRRVLVQRAGSYDRLQIQRGLEPPVPGPDEVLVETEAAGVNYADCVVRMGLYESAKEYVGWPITPGFELSGRVAKVGAHVQAFREGQAVFGVTRFGAYASHVVVPQAQLFPLPKQLGMLEAAAFPAVFLTAWFPLFELTRLRPGMRVLVHSAAGGVGSALVQLAKLAGCDVTGVVGASHKVEAVRALGADLVIDKSAEPLWERARAHAPQGFDVVLDANGVETLRQSYAHVAPGGRLVIYGFHTMLPREGGRPDWLKLAWDWLRTPRFNPLDLTNRNRSVLAFNLSYLFDRTALLREAMGQLLGWLEEGRLTPPRVTPYDFEKVADAHRALESGRTVGKLVLRLGDPGAPR